MDLKVHKGCYLSLYCCHIKFVVIVSKYIHFKYIVINSI